MSQPAPSQPTSAHRVDLYGPVMDHLFGSAAQWRKKVEVSARPAVPGERVVTVLSDGTVETMSRRAVDRDMVVTGVGGEQYLLSPDTFADRYEPTATPGRFRAVGRCVAFVNPTGAEVVIAAPWGEDQFGGPDCWFAAALGRDGAQTGDRYIIGAAEMLATYELDT